MLTYLEFIYLQIEYVSQVYSSPVICRPFDSDFWHQVRLERSESYQAIMIVSSYGKDAWFYRYLGTWNYVPSIVYRFITLCMGTACFPLQRLYMQESRGLVELKSGCPQCFFMQQSGRWGVKLFVNATYINMLFSNKFTVGCLVGQVLQMHRSQFFYRQM